MSNLVTPKITPSNTRSPKEQITMDDIHKVKLPKEQITMDDIHKVKLPKIVPSKVDLSGAIEKHKDTAASMNTTISESLKPVLDDPIATQEMAERIIASAPQEVQTYVKEQTDAIQDAVIYDVMTSFATVKEAIQAWSDWKRVSNIVSEGMQKKADFEKNWLDISNKAAATESAERAASNKTDSPITNLSYTTQQRFGVAVRNPDRKDGEQVRSVYLGGFKPITMGESAFLELADKLSARRDMLVHRIGHQYVKPSDRHELANIDTFIKINGLGNRPAGAFPELSDNYPYSGFDATPPERQKGITKLGWEATIGDRYAIELEMHKKWGVEPKKIHSLDSLDHGDSDVDKASLRAELSAPISKAVDEGVQQLRFMSTYLAKKGGLADDEAVMQAFETMQNSRLKYEWMGESTGAVKWVQDAVGAFGSMCVIMTPALAGEFIVGKTLTKFGGKWMTAQVIASLAAKTGKTISVISESLMEQSGVMEDLYQEKLSKYDRSKYTHREWAQLKEDLFDDAYMASFATLAANLAITGLMPDYFSPNGAIRGKAFKRALRQAREAGKTGLMEAGQEGLQSAVSQLNVIFAKGLKITDFSALQVLYESSVGFGPGAVMHYVAQATKAMSGDILSSEDIEDLVGRAQKQVKMGEMFLSTLIEDGKIKVDIENIPVEALTEILMEAGQMASMLNAEGTGPHEMYAETYEALGKNIKNSLEGWQDARTFYEKESAKINKERGKPSQSFGGEQSSQSAWNEMVDQVEFERNGQAEESVEGAESISVKDSDITLSPVEELKQKAANDKVIPGKDVAEHVDEISRETDESGEGMKLSEDEKSKISEREYKEENVDLNKLLESDPDFKAAHEARNEAGGLASRYKGQELSNEELDQPVTVIDGELIDGYSRASELLSQGESEAGGYVAIEKPVDTLRGKVGAKKQSKPKKKSQTPSPSDIPGMRLKSLGVIENDMRQKMSRNEVFMLLKAKGVTRGEMDDLKIKEWVNEDPKGKVIQSDVLEMLKKKSPKLAVRRNIEGPPSESQQEERPREDVESDIEGSIDHVNRLENDLERERKLREGAGVRERALIDNEIEELEQAISEEDFLQQTLYNELNEIDEAMDGPRHKSYSVQGRSENPENYTGYREILVIDKKSGFVESSHYEDHGIAYTVRGVDIVGESDTFLIDEIQSDAHQQGRKKGYRDKQTESGLRMINIAANQFVRDEKNITQELSDHLVNTVLNDVGLMDALRGAASLDQGTAPAISWLKNYYVTEVLLAAREVTLRGDPVNAKSVLASLELWDSTINHAIGEGIIGYSMEISLLDEIINHGRFMELVEIPSKQLELARDKQKLSERVDATALKTSWIKAGIQTAIVEAVINGRGEVSIATGFEQIERYFGKDVAEYYYADKGERARMKENTLNHVFESEEALKVMKSLDGFYNKRLPDMLKKFGNKRGAEVGIIKNDDGVARWTLKLNSKIDEEVHTKSLSLHSTVIKEGESSRVPITPTAVANKSLLKQVKKRGVAFVEFLIGENGSKGLENLRSKWNKEHSDPVKHSRKLARQSALTMAKNQAQSLGFTVWLNRIIKNEQALTLDYTGASIDLDSEAGRKDFALLAELMRSRNFEVGRLLFIKDGVVLMSTERTFGLPDQTTLVPVEFEGIGAREDITNIYNQARAMGCDEVILLHNHPTSEVVPSDADLNAHRVIQELFRENNNLSGGNITAVDITINHGMFSIMGPVVPQGRSSRRINSPMFEAAERGRLKAGMVESKADPASLRSEEDLSTYGMEYNDLVVVKIRSVMGSIDRLLGSELKGDAAKAVESDLAEFIHIPERELSAMGIVRKLENLADQGKMDGQDFAIAYLDPHGKLTGIVTVSYESLKAQLGNLNFWAKMRAEFGGLGILVPLNERAGDALTRKDLLKLYSLNAEQVLAPPANLAYGGDIATYGGTGIGVSADSPSLSVEASRVSPEIRAFESLWGETQTEMGYDRRIDIRNKGKRSQAQAEARLHEAAVHDILIKAKELGLDVAKFKQWYSESITAMREQLVKDLPALAEPGNMILFDMMLAIMSTGTSVATNYDNAFDAISNFLKTGALKIGKNKSQNNVLLNSRGKIIGGLTGRDMYATMMKVINAMEGMGVGELHKWLMRSDVSKQEFSDVFDKEPAGSTAENNKGHLVFGPKVGEFYAAISGSTNALVIDRWMMYWAVRHLGVMTEISTNKGKKTRGRIEDPKNKGTREMMSRAFSKALAGISEATGESWTMSELQAALWMIEKSVHANKDMLAENVNAINDFEAAALTREERDGKTKLEANGRSEGKGNEGISVRSENITGQSEPIVDGTAQQITIETAQEIADAINNNGGFTYDPITGKLIGGVSEDTWTVSVLPEISHKAQAQKNITAEQVQEAILDFMKNSKKAAPGLNDIFEVNSGFKLGGWVNDSGVFFIDVSVLITESRYGGKAPAKLKAIQLAKEQNQQAIFNLNDFTELNVGKSGKSRKNINIIAEAKALGNKYGTNMKKGGSSGAQKLVAMAKRMARAGGRKSALGRAIEAVRNAREISRNLRKKSIADHVSNFYTKWFDPHWPAIRAVKKALKIQGRKIGGLAPSANPVILARTMMRWTAIADSFLRGKGVAKWDNANEYTSESLEKIIRGIKEKDLDAFNAYLAARRVLDLAETKGEGFVDAEVLAENEDIVDEVLAKHPTWAEIASKVTAFSNAVLEYIKDAGLISGEEYDHLVEMHRDYVPMYVLTILDENGRPTSDYKDGARIASVWKPISEMDKNTVRVPPLESIIKNTHFLINLALENEFKKSIVDAVGDSAPDIVNPIARIEKGEHGVTVEQLEEIVDTEGMTDEQIAMLLKLSSSRMIGDRGRIAVLRDGTTEIYDVDPGIYHVVSNMAKSNTAPWMKFLAAISGAKLLRTGAVLAPEFTMRNPLRDILGSSILGNFVLPLNPYHFMKALSQYIGNTDMFYQWINSGGSLGSMLGTDINEARREVLGANEKKSQQEVYELKRSSLHGKKEYMLSASGLLQLISPVFWGRRGVGAIRTISEGMESVSRLSTYDRRLHALMKDVADGKMSIRDAQLMAAYESVEGSIDFLRQGEWAADVNRVWPFFSALLGGVDTTFKKLAYDPTGMTTKSHRAKVWGSGAMLAAASLFLWNQYKDDEEYKAIPLKVKLMAWPVKIGDSWWYIPKPFELGFIFATLPELFAQHVYDNEPGLIEDALEGFLHTTLPSGLPFPIPVAIGQAAANYDMFYDARIEGRTDETLPRHMRYSSHTSIVARELGAEAKKLRNMPLIGKGFDEGLSPKKIDFIVRGAGGGLARFAVQLISDSIRVTKPEIYGNAPSKHYIWWKISAETPGIMGLVDPAPLRRTIHVEKFYEYLNKSRHTMGAMNSITSGGGTHDDMVTALSEDWFWVGAAGAIAGQAEMMSDINKSISMLEHGGMLEKGGTMSPDERRDKIDELITNRNTLAKMTVEKIDEQHEKITGDPEMVDEYREIIIKNAKRLLLDYESETK